MAASTISKDMMLFFSHPFCLGQGNAPVARHERLRKMSQLAKSLSSRGFAWETFDIEEVLPAVWKKRKDVVIRTPQVDNPRMLEVLREINAPYASTREIVGVKHSAFYYDYGLGGVDVEISIRLKSTEGLTNLYDVAEKFEAKCFEEDLYLPPGPCANWTQVGDQFWLAFFEVGLKPMRFIKNEFSDNFLLETCCWSILLKTDPAGLAVSAPLMDAAIAAFCGSDTTEDTFKTGVEEIPCAHTGYSGNAAVVVDEHTWNRTLWLWRMVALLYGALLDSTEPVYDVVSDLVDDGKASQSAYFIRTLRMMIDVLHNESLPEIVLSESLDDVIYGKIWEAWGGPKLETAVDARADYLGNVMNDLASQRSQSLQARLNVVVFVLTIVSVASTVATIISLEDYQNDLSSQDRGLALGIISGLVAVFCVLVIVADFTPFYAFIQSVRDARLRLVLKAAPSQLHRGRGRSVAGSVADKDEIQVKVEQ